MALYVGDAWAEDHHDVHLMDESGGRLAARRLPEGVAGVTALHELVAQHASDPGEVVVGIETDRGPWVSALVAAGYHVYAINPRSASRYRDRHHVGGASRSLHTDLALGALEQALWSRQGPFGGLVHHSDRGVQYLSIRYTERLAEVGRSVPWAAAATPATTHWRSR